MQNNSNHLVSTWYTFHTLSLILTTTALMGFFIFSLSQMKKLKPREDKNFTEDNTDGKSPS